VVRSFQISATFGHMSALENVRVACSAAGHLLPLLAPESTLNQLNAEAMELLEEVDLADFAARWPVEMPYGRKRALEIATTLALDPKLMLLDEPTQGMGHEDVDMVTRADQAVAANRTVLMVEHNLSVVEKHRRPDHRAAAGQILAEGPYARCPRTRGAGGLRMGSGSMTRPWGAMVEGQTA
jgi:branched-chain amino acid transport system ATP-binding protein